MRLRIIVPKSTDRANDLQTAVAVRRDLWSHSSVEVDPERPLHGTHRDTEGRAYFELSTRYPEEVRRVLRERGYAERVEVKETDEPLGEACQNCGNVSGPVLPSVCPNCCFRDISPCPHCGQEVPRQDYVASGRQFRCPRCRTRVRLRFNDPMFRSDGSYNQPLVVVEGAMAENEVR